MTTRKPKDLLTIFFLSLFFLAGLILFFNGQVFEYRTHSIDETLRGYHYQEVLPVSLREISQNNYKQIKTNKSGLRFFYTSSDNKKILMMEDEKEYQIVEQDNLIRDFDINEEGTELVFLLELENEKKINLYHWEEGINKEKGENLILDQKLKGNWRVLFSKNSKRIILYPGDNSAEVLDNNLKKNGIIVLESDYRGEDENYPNEALLSAKKRFNIFSLNDSENIKLDLPLDEKNIIKRNKFRYSDIDGDGSDDMLLFQNTPDLPFWRVKTLSNIEGATLKKTSSYEKFSVWRLGDGDGVPLTGDFDGDGKLDFATYTPNHLSTKVKSTTNWQIFLSAKNFSKTFSLSFGFGKHYPLTFDYDGDGRTDIVIYDPELGIWHFLFSKGEFNIVKALKNSPNYGSTIQWGAFGDYPLVGDLDGNGRLDLVVCSNPSTIKEDEKLHWRIKLFIPNLPKGKNIDFYFGEKGDVPFIGDFNGDGRDEPTVFNTKTKSWKIRYSLENKTTKKGEIKEEVVSWNVDNSYPIVGDFDGDGVTDFAFYSLVNRHRWYILSSRFKSDSPKLFPAGRTPVSAHTFGEEYVSKDESGESLPPQVLQRRAFFSLFSK